MLPVIQNRIHREGYSILVDGFTPTQARAQSNSIFNPNTIDGAFFFGGMIEESQLESIRNSQIPSVLICARDDDVDFVDTDPKEGIRLAAQYMIDHGHRQIALINGSDCSQASMQKLEGYQQALAENGLPQDSNLVEFTDFSGVSVWSAMDRLTSKGLKPTAIIGATDFIACAICMKRTYAVPRVSPLSDTKTQQPRSILPPPLPALTSIRTNWVRKRPIRDSVASL